MSAPAVQFAIGTSSTTAASAAETNVDKSLDDLIKDRRKEAAATAKKQRAGLADLHAQVILDTSRKAMQMLQLKS